MHSEDGLVALHNILYSKHKYLEFQNNHNFSSYLLDMSKDFFVQNYQIFLSRSKSGRETGKYVILCIFDTRAAKTRVAEHVYWSRNIFCNNSNNFTSFILAPSVNHIILLGQYVFMVQCIPFLFISFLLMML